MHRTVRRLPPAVVAFLIAAAALASLLWALIPTPTAPVRVRWSDGLAAGERLDLERRFGLADGELAEGTTWAYALEDYSADNIRELVQHPRVADTHGVNRGTFAPDVYPESRVVPLATGAALGGLVAALLVVVWPRLRGLRLRAATLAPVAAIVIVVTLTYLPALASGDNLMVNRDFFLFAARHEAVAQSIRQHGELPLRSHWFGGGFYTLADPEDPTLSPLVLFSIALGAVRGIKAIGYVTMLVAGLGTFAFARHVLGYTRWGALFSALVFGLCLFVPNRIAGGNPNEVVAVWIPLCLLLVALAVEGRRWALAAAGVVFYTMISDGKLAGIMAMLFVGVLCALALVPALRVFPAPSAAGPRANWRPVTCFLAAVAVCVVIGLPRLLPAFELIVEQGGITPMLPAHPGGYVPEAINGYSVDELWKGVLGWGRGSAAETLNRDLVTVGIVPVALAGVATLVFWRQTLGWLVALVLFSWLILAHHAPIDLLRVLWELPVFDTVYRPYKYFSAPIAFTIAILAGRSFHLLSQLQPRRAEVVLAVGVIAFTVGFLQPRASSMLSAAFVVEHPETEPAGFFNVSEEDAASPHPLGAYPYLNVRRGVGTLVNYSTLVMPTNVTPKYIVSEDDRYVENAAYRGEAYLDNPAAGRVTSVEFEPNGIGIAVELEAAGVVRINQNYHRDWHTDRGTLSNDHGLLALHLTEPGSYTVRLSYHPRSFYAGVALTTLAILAGLVFRRNWYTGPRLPSAA